MIIKKLKTIHNTKDWTKFGWIYSMRRIVDGQVYAINICIDHYEMHHRYVVALKLRRARLELHRAILKHQL